MSRRRPDDRRPILVTGVPRSGTTWLARWLARAEGTALAGREPMNPRGRQYALAGTLDGWARLTEPTARQRVALVTAYRGWNPLVYSRYGARQWAAPLPYTRLVVKDPFAMLSMPAVHRVTGARPVLVYRHPGAVLTSYRRMGWTPDLEEVQDVVDAARAGGGPVLDDIPGDLDPAAAMGVFWSRLHELALADLESAPELGCVVVSHAELASSGAKGGRRLCAHLGLEWNEDLEHELAAEAGTASAPPRSAATPEAASGTRLHQFDRAPAEVAEAWRTRLTTEELELVERVSAPALARLEALRLPLSG